MIKKIILGSLFLFSLQALAQDGTASAYSYYGIGEIKFKGTIENRSMGGVGVLNDSIHINLQNPASLSSLKLTTYTVGGNYNNSTLKSSSASEKAKRVSLDYLAIAFPVGKWSASLGLMPYSSVGYKIQNTNELKSYNGTGGLNKVFVAAGYQITPKLSAGLDVGYNFGEIKRSEAVFKSGIQNGTRLLQTDQLSGMSFNTGFNFKTKFKKYDVVSSLTFSPSIHINSNAVEELAVLQYNSLGQELISDPRVITTSQSYRLPSKFAFGAGIGEDKKWFVAFESTLQGKPNYNIVYPKATFETAAKFSLGGYYIPKYNSFNNYFNKVVYRAGFRHENTGLVVNSESIKDTAFTLGLGFPVGTLFSNANVGFEVGKRGTINSGLVQENYMNLSVGLSFNDKWFVKRKFN